MGLLKTVKEKTMSIETVKESHVQDPLLSRTLDVLSVTADYPDPGVEVWGALAADALEETVGQDIALGALTHLVAEERRPDAVVTAVQSVITYGPIPTVRPVRHEETSLARDGHIAAGYPRLSPRRQRAGAA
jgi:hypothetical protein